VRWRKRKKEKERRKGIEREKCFFFAVLVDPEARGTAAGFSARRSGGIPVMKAESSNLE
jgi:hypothetical protein